MKKIKKEEYIALQSPDTKSLENDVSENIENAESAVENKELFIQDLQNYIEDFGETAEYIPIDKIEAIINGKENIQDLIKDPKDEKVYIKAILDYKNAIEELGYDLTSEQLDVINSVTNSSFKSEEDLDKTQPLITLDYLESVVKDPKLKEKISNYEENKDFFLGFPKNVWIENIKKYYNALEKKDSISIGISNISEIIYDRNIEHYGKRFVSDEKLNEEFKNDILAFIPRVDGKIDSSVSKIELAKEIYKRLNSRVKYSQTYRALVDTGNVEVLSKIYNQDISSVTLQENEVICNSWSKIYCKLLEEIGCESVITGDGKHKYVTFIADDEIIEADGTNAKVSDIDGSDINDLARSKLDMPIAGFKIKTNREKQKEIMSKEKEETKVIDITKILEMDGSFDKDLSSKVLGSSIETKLKLLNDSFVNTVNENADSLDMMAYLNVVMTSVFTKEEMEKIQKKNISINRSEGGESKYDVSRIISVKSEKSPDEFSCYVIATSGELQPISKEEIIERFNRGEYENLSKKGEELAILKNNQEKVTQKDVEVVDRGDDDGEYR